MVVLWIISLLSVFVATIHMIPDRDDIEGGRLVPIIVGLTLTTILLITLIYMGVQIWFRN